MSESSVREPVNTAERTDAAIALSATLAVLEEAAEPLINPGAAADLLGEGALAGRTALDENEPAVADLVPPDLVVGAALGLRALIMAGERYRTTLAASIGLGTTETQAIGYLYLHHARGQADLARDLGLTSSAATALVDRLERHGVARRTRHTHDRRRLQVSLTDEGERLAVLAQQPLLDTLAQIPPADLTTLTMWLDVLATELHRRSGPP